MTELLIVPGTSAWEPDEDLARPRNYWRPGSPLARYLARHDLALLHPEDPYVWSTDLNGWKFWRRWFGQADEPRDWKAGGKSLRWWVTAKGHRQLGAAWVHSHGLQPFAFAAAEWHEPIFCDSLVSFGSPIRSDVPYEAMLRKVRRWLVVTDTKDLTQLLGRIGDGAIGGTPDEFGDKVEILELRGIDHSRLLQDPSMFDALDGHRILAFTRGEEIAYV